MTPTIAHASESEAVLSEVSLLNVQRLLKHAANFGSESVYEIAERRLSLPELLELVTILPTVSPSWELTKAERTDLALRMLATGLSIPETSSLIGLAKSRLYELRQELDGEAPDDTDQTSSQRVVGDPLSRIDLKETH